MNDTNKDNESCSMQKDSACTAKPCVIKGFILPTVAVFVLIFLYEYLFHGIFMKPHYEATADLWRTPEEMEALIHISVIRVAVVSAVISMLYCCSTKYSPCSGMCPMKGAKFGFMIGLMLGIWDFGAYAWLPIPMEIALAWLGGSIVMGILAGILLSMLKRCLCSKDNGSCSIEK